MSTILKALRRLEKDKTQKVQRPLREEVASGTESRRRVPVVLIAALVFSAGIGLGAAALFLWPGGLPGIGQDGSARASAKAAAKAPRERAGTEKAAPEADWHAKRTGGENRKPTSRTPKVRPGATPRAQAPPPEPAKPAVSQEVALVRRIEPQTLGVQGEAAEPPRPPRSGEVRPAAEALKADPDPPAWKAPPKPADVPVLVDSGGPDRPAESADAYRDEEQPPAPALGGNVPVILVSRTRWHPQSDRREALIEIERADGPEERRVHEGDAVGPLVVSRIEPSGVVFLYDDVELRHGVGR